MFRPHTLTTLIHVSSSELESSILVTFKWKRSKNPVGMQQILLDLVCDLAIRSCGDFSDFAYPPYIVKQNERMTVSGTAWTTASRARYRLPSAYPPTPRLHKNSGLESRAHTNPTSHLSAHGGTLRFSQYSMDVHV